MARTFMISLEDTEVDFVMGVLTQTPLPYARVAPLIQKLDSQLRSQLVPPPDAPVEPLPQIES